MKGGGFVHLFRLLAFAGPCFGVLIPNLDQLVKWPKVVVPMLNYSCFPGLFLVSVYMVENILELGLRLLDKNLGMIIHHTVSVCNMGVYLGRLLIFLYYRKDIGKLCHMFDRFIVQLQDRPTQMKKLQRRRTLVNMICIPFTAMVLLNTSIVLVPFVIKTHTGPHATIMPVPDSVIIVYHATHAFYFLFNTGIYHWILLSFISMPALQFENLSESLSDIFSEVYLNYDFRLRIKNKILRRSVTPKEESVVPIDEDYKLTNFQISKIDKALNEWIRNYIQTKHCATELNRIFIGPVSLGYVGSVLQILSFIFVGRNTKEKHHVSLPIYAALSMMILFANCYFGDDLRRKSEDVTVKALGSDWFLYPVSIQKKLLLTYQVSNNKPSSITAIAHLYPLDLETYYAVVKLAYSMYTFAASMLD